MAGDGARKFNSIADLEAAAVKATNALTKRRILIGIPSDAKQEGAGQQKAPPLWVIGYQNEFGDDDLNIPPRPFLVPGVNSKKEEIVKGLQKAAAFALSGDLDRADAWLDGVGEIAKGGVKELLYSGTLQPLSPKAIYNRQHRKGPPKTPPPNSRTSPLVDQGDLLRNIQSVVKRGQ